MNKNQDHFTDYKIEDLLPDMALLRGLVDKREKELRELCEKYGPKAVFLGGITNNTDSEQ